MGKINVYEQKRTEKKKKEYMEIEKNYT